MERIGRQGDRFLLSGHLVEVGRDAAVDQRRDHHHQHAPANALDGAGGDQLVDRLEDDPASGQQDKQCFDDAGDIFNLVVAIGVALIGWEIGLFHREQCDQGRHQIHRGVDRLRDDTDRAAGEPGHHFHDDQTDIGADRHHGGSGFSVHVQLPE